MKANRQYILITLCIIISLAALSMAFYAIKGNKKVAWIKLQTVYEKFEYKKELEAKLLGVQQNRKYILDSLEFELKVLSNQITNDKGRDKEAIAVFQTKRDEYLNRKKTFEEDNAMLTGKYDEQILNQLNQYVKDYAEEQGYDIIYSADGSGAIMAASDDLEITDKITVYLNDRYKGLSK
jgi:outer membrane protein